MSRNLEFSMINEETRALNDTLENSEHEFECYAQKFCYNGKTRNTDFCF